MRRLVAFVVVPVLLLAGGAGPAAAGVEQTIAEAVELYGAGLDTPERDLRLETFRRAERLFARAASDERATTALYTNLGNAALQAEHLGAAVLAYRRALVLDPTHPRAVQNLAHARSLLPDWLPKPREGGLLDSFFFWHRTLTHAQRALAAAAAFALAALLLAASIRQAQPGLRMVAVVPALVWVTLLASLAVDVFGSSAGSAGAQDEAVITADEVVARAADSALAPSALPAPLPGGAEVRVLERRAPWTRIRLANGRAAWVAQSALTEVARR